MEYTYEFFEKSAQYVREKLDFQPEIGIILGSSLGPFAAQVENPVVIPYEDIPNFLRSTVATHAGKLICGTVSGKKVNMVEDNGSTNAEAPLTVVNTRGTTSRS